MPSEQKKRFLRERITRLVFRRIQAQTVPSSDFLAMERPAGPCNPTQRRYLDGDAFAPGVVLIGDRGRTQRSDHWAGSFDSLPRRAHRARV